MSTRPGFTLIEVVVAIGAATILMMAVAWLVPQSFRSNAIMWEQLKTQRDGRQALRTVVDELRRAELSSVGAYPLDTTDAYELIVYSNVDADASIERLRFWLDGTTLKRGVVDPSGDPLRYVTSTESTRTLATDVINEREGAPLFLYYDASYTGIQDPLVQPVAQTDVRVIRTQLKLERDPTASPTPLHIEGVVQVRNVKDM